VAPSAPFSPIAPPSLFPGADRHAVFMVLKHAKVQFESNRELQVVSVQPHTHTHTHTHMYTLWYTVAYVSAPFCKKLCAFLGGEKELKGCKAHPWQVVSLTPTSGQVSHRKSHSQTHIHTHTETESHVELMYACACPCVCVACPAGVINL